jgi:hypothetical protein
VLTIGETVRGRTAVTQTERIAVNAFRNNYPRPAHSYEPPIRVLVEPDASVRSTLIAIAHTPLDRARAFEWLTCVASRVPCVQRWSG